MIPRVVHYCWFGRNPLPASAVKCIESWRHFMPGYEIKEWNEDNFDVNSVPYISEAYAAKKYAFVSDYARFWILYHYGGVYFDTDVELIKPVDDILERGAFMGIEDIYPEHDPYPLVAPGLGMAVEAGHEFYKKELDYYAGVHFLLPDGTYDHETVVRRTTALLVQEGLEPRDALQQVAGIWIYPKEYFNPLDDLTGRLEKTKNTRSIHWYARTWQNRSPLKQWLSRWSHRVFGFTLHKIKNFITGAKDY